MSAHRKLFPLLITILVTSSFIRVAAQEEVSWLKDYTDEMTIGNDTYRYRFTSVDGNECKVKIEEQVTDRKGSVEMHSWIFYLSDIDPAALRFNARGKSIEVNLETRNSQEFISYYEEGEFEEYTDQIELTMNEVDMTRQLIDALREQIDACRQTEAAWDDREAAFSWLVENIGEAVDDDVQWEQVFSRGSSSHLAGLSAKSVDDKGEEESFEYLFDLTDINLSSIKLEVSGRSLAVEVPVRDGENYIEVTTPDEKEYTDELKIYADDIEVARQIVNALSYVVSNTRAERPQWSSYAEALGFVKENLGKVTIDDDVYENSLDFGDSPSGIVKLTVKETDSDGETEEVTYSFYLADMADRLNLDVSSDEITIEMETRDDRDYIMEESGGSVSGYASDLEFHAAGIDGARDMMSAFGYAIEHSEEEIQEFTTVAGVNGWMMQNLVPLYREGEKYEQSLLVDEEMRNRIEFERKLTEDDGGVTETKYLVYPEDISLEELEIDVRWGRLNVALETNEDDYIKNSENGALQDFTDEVEVYFSDPLVAKSFLSAIRFLKGNAMEEETPEMGREEAFSFLTGNIPDIELTGETYEQTLEMMDGDDCKLRFTRVETDDDGETDEYIYEFMVSDIDRDNSGLSVDGKIIEINLETVDNDDLIKPFENGEVEDFEDEFTIFADDVLLAKRLLNAFGALSEACR